MPDDGNSWSPDGGSVPIIAGWREVVSLPEWNVPRLVAKLDTGANTSAIHADTIEDLDDGHVRFEVISDEDGTLTRHPVMAKVIRRTRVRSSTGHSTMRYVVETTMTLGQWTGPVELSLVSRRGMLNRMLLGRRALGGHFLVDSSRSFVLTSRPELKRKRSRSKA